MVGSDDQHLFNELSNIARNGPLEARNAASVATAEELVARGYAVRNADDRFVLTRRGRNLLWSIASQSFDVPDDWP